MTTAAWRQVTSSEPCPICGKSDWCRRSADGAAAICRRVDTGEGQEREDRAGGTFWLYHLNGAPQRPYTPPTDAEPDRGDPDTLHRVYAALLKSLALSAAHRDALLGRGLPAEVIQRAGYRTLPARGRAELAGKLADAFGADVCATVPGWYVKAERGESWPSLAGAAGLVVPCRDADGRIVALKVRADDPGPDRPRYSYMSSSSRGGPGPGAPVHLPVGRGDRVAGEVRLTEGELKADVATALSGLLTVSVPGVSNWRPALPVLHQLGAETVRLAFDADAETNPHVARALARCAAALQADGFRVLLETWPADAGKGIDDLLAAGGTPETKEAEPMPEEGQAASARIVVTGRYFDQKIDDARAAVEAANNPPDLFMRAGELVEVAPDETGWPVIRGVKVSSLRDRMARAAAWCKLVKAGPPDAPQWKETPTDPPKDVVESAMARPELWRVPPLEAVTQVPTLRPDGSLLLTPGYDAPTRLYYIPPRHLRLPPVPDAPTQEQAAEALARVWRLFAEFPFVDPEADRAGILALLLTPIVRAAVVGPTPMSLIDAPQQGTGKSLLAELVSIVAIGQSSFANAPAKEDEAEWRKLLTTLLAAGNTVIAFDNVDGVLRSAALAKAITDTSWTDRYLSTNKECRVPVRATWIATGNNLRIGGDLARRCYRIRIDARTAEPWERKGFTIPNVRGYALKHRGELLADLLTMARAWYAAGQPEAPGLPNLGSFEEWRRIVGGILAFAGVRGFLANLRELYEEADPDAAAWRAFLEAWRDVYGSEPVTTKQVADVIDAAVKGADQGSLMAEEEAPREALAEALPEFLRQPDGRVNRRSMGKQLDKVAGRRYPPDNIRLERETSDSDTHRARWRVVADRNAGSSNPLLEPISEGSPAFPAFVRTNAWGKDSADDSSLAYRVEQTPETPDSTDKPALQADSSSGVSVANAGDDDDCNPQGEDW